MSEAERLGRVVVGETGGLVATQGPLHGARQDSLQGIVCLRDDVACQVGRDHGACVVVVHTLAGHIHPIALDTERHQSAVAVGNARRRHASRIRRGGQPA